MKRKFKTRLLSYIMVGVMMSLNFATVKADTNQFNDVTSYYPYNSWAVETGKKHNLIFLENNNRESKRYEIASLLYYFLDLGNSKENTKFNDLDGIDTNNKNKINAIAEANIISGYADGSFKPNNNVTRAEFVTMLDRSGLLKKANKTTNITKFSDTENHWAKSSIEYVSSLGLIAGKGNNQFCPDSSITPQEILIIADRLTNIGCITDYDLLNAMQNTFDCKQYSDEEEYLTEVIYSEFDKVQTFMQYAFPYKEYYNYNAWNELATYEDIQYVTYFMMSYNSALWENGETRNMFNNIGNTILSKKTSSGDYFTIRDFLHAVSEIEVVANVYMYGYGSNRNTQMPALRFTNVNEFLQADNEMFRRILGNQNNTLLSNIPAYFPLDAPLTKYMLNYFAMRLEESYNSYNKSLSSGISQYQGHGIEYETDSSKMPKNYYEYPYIIKGIPKELYEKPYSYSYNYFTGTKLELNTPIECYGKYSEVAGTIGDYIRIYYDTILNVDYRTLDETKFANDVSRIFYYVSDEEIKKYIQYVKDNQIIIEGKGAAVPGTMFQEAGLGTLYMKSIVEFKVISAKEMKNLLFADLWTGLGYDIEYTQKEYLLYPDIAVQTGPYIYNGEVTNIRKLEYRSLHLALYPYGESHKLP